MLFDAGLRHPILPKSLSLDLTFPCSCTFVLDHNQLEPELSLNEVCYFIFYKRNKGSNGRVELKMADTWLSSIVIVNIKERLTYCLDFKAKEACKKLNERNKTTCMSWKSFPA